MTAQQPRLLFISPVMPDSTGNGLAMRQAQFLIAYARDFEVDLAVLPLAGSAAASPNFAASHTRRRRVFSLAEPDTHFELLSRLKTPEDRLAAFKNYGRPSILARLTPAVHQALNDWVVGQNYQLVHTGRLYLMSLGSVVDAPWVVDADEDDAALWRQLGSAARRVGNWVEAGWSDVEACHAERLVVGGLWKAAHVFAASREDVAHLSPYCRTTSVVPNVVALPRHARMKLRPRLLFVGTLGYGPNRDGLVWFIKYCWPVIHKTNPDAALDVVGGGADMALRRLMGRPGICWHGWQPRLLRFYARSAVSIVPIRLGGGSRIKTLEAAAYGRVIVATKKGATGTRLCAGRDFLLAETPRQFHRAILRALRGAKRFPGAARQAVARHHNPLAWQREILRIADVIAFRKTV
ncbi:MAG: hypothetical protein B7Z75_06475 [Acidocella sp. 20-57-95]|nr:MAG: hypothetical protein B7Z75_06475 [Acidocella sp. 20-57-95]HQT64787.1 glycosyltransferase family 4 protein [Acidocella sp.]